MYSFTGWYYITALTPGKYSDLFRTYNVLGNTATPGQHLLHVQLNEDASSLAQVTDTSTGVDWVAGSPAVVSFR